MRKKNNAKIYILGLISLFILTNSVSYAQKCSLRDKIQGIIENADGTIGIAIKNLNTNDTLTFNGSYQFPMQSVYKFPLALAVLNRVDKGELSLKKQIIITKDDLLPDTWSPLREKYPNGNVNIPLREIISYTVSQSDNNGCDILFRLLGGTKAVNDYIHSLGIKDISIMGTEEEMHNDWNVQFTNWCKPNAMVQLLELFQQKNVLSEPSSNFLWNLMVETSTGSNRLKGMLPSGTVVAHKTGSSGQNEKGISAATNDIGIIELPNGQRIAIAIFITNSKADSKTNDAVIARISKTTYEFYSKR